MTDAAAPLPSTSSHWLQRVYAWAVTHSRALPWVFLFALISAPKAGFLLGMLLTGGPPEEYPPVDWSHREVVGVIQLPETDSGAKVHWIRVRTEAGGIAICPLNVDEQFPLAGEIRKKKGADAYEVRASGDAPWVRVDPAPDRTREELHRGVWIACSVMVFLVTLFGYVGATKLKS